MSNVNERRLAQELQTNPNGEATVLDEFVPAKEVKIRDQAGRVNLYLINEISGSKDYWNWMSKLTKIKPDAALSGEHTITELQEELIQQCLTCNGQQVPMDVIQGWGMKLKATLFEMCQEQNGMTPSAVEAEGKESGNAATTTGGSALPNEPVKA